LDPQVRVTHPARTSLVVVDAAHGTLLLYDGARPAAVYALGGPARLALGRHAEVTLSMSDEDARALASLVRGVPARVLRAGEHPPPGDRDRDGIPDPLDIVRGGLKLLVNRAAYTEGYVHMSYPAGDVPRTIGVCTDVLVRAIRNAGLDLQKELRDDIGRAPASYPMVKRPDSSIDHRRVRTLLPYFRRHWEAHDPDPRSVDDPFQPGDVLFFDTFPSRSGPDHVGIVMDRVGESGLPVVVNNWTTGSWDAELDFLWWLPVTHRFRMPKEAAK
jgi:uncharacterized protein YijF (DUF1287 family)